jgi:hypothetical protein
LIIPSLIGLGSAWPVKIGALSHSAWDVENILQKFCEQIFALTDYPEYPYRLLGSGAAIQMEGRHFLFCCRHQIRDCSPDKIAIPLSFDAKIFSATTMRALAVTDDNRDDEILDAIVFEFNVGNYGVPNLTSEFLFVDDSRIWPSGTAQMPFMIFGYPSDRQLYDEERIGARCISIQGVYDGAMSSPHLHRVKLEKSIAADGMSGGPVFYIGSAPGNYFVGFVGIAMRGGKNSDYLHFMTAHFLIQMAFDPSTVPWT